MSATRTRSRNGSAPEQEPAPAPELEPSAPLVDLDEQVSTEETGKSRKVYVETTPRAPLGDGRFTCIAKEVRADGSHGPTLLALVRINEREPKDSDRRESISYSLASDVRLQVLALRAAGVKFLS